MLWHIFQDVGIDRPVALMWWYPKDIPTNLKFRSDLAI